MKALATPKFIKKFQETSAPDLVAREIAELFDQIDRRRRNTTTGWPINLRPVVGLPKNWPVLREWRITQSARIILTESSNPVLVDFDLNHTSLDNLTSNSSASNVNHQIGKAEIIEISTPESLELDSLEIRIGNHGAPGFAEEFFDEWVYFLDAQQVIVRDEILKDIEATKGHQVFILLAGAGTGKTTVLTNLSFGLDSKGIKSALSVNPGVRGYLQSADRKIPALDRGSSAIDVSVVLLDDPLTLDTMKSAIDSARIKSQKIVIGIDPTQWHQRRLAEHWKAFESNYSYKTFSLDMAYRQSKGVGDPTAQFLEKFLANSSAFVDSVKVKNEHNIMRPIWQKCLTELKFVNPDGGFEFFRTDWTEELLLQEFREIHLRKTERTWPPLLIGHQVEFQAKHYVANLLEKHGIPALDYHSRVFSEMTQVRGTEYDYVIIFMQSDKWQKLKSGKLGADTGTWEDLNTTLTFMTRAKFHVSIYLTDNIVIGD
jgi:hypothetical protein